jgi:glycosyltransferase
MALKISIITVSFNSENTIRDTLESVRCQDYSSVEHIIIDGASTDRTLEIIKHSGHVAKVISERDNGLYDAMNKGIAEATGDIIGILNSDDVYENSGVLTQIARIFESSGADTVYGDLQYVKQDDLNKTIRYWKSGSFQRTRFYYGWMPPHPTFYVRKHVYQEVGMFNTQLRSAADYEMMLRILVRHHFTAAYIPRVLVKMRAGGVSNGSIRNRVNANMEDRKAWRINDIKPYFFTMYLKPLRKVTQFFKR